MATTVYEREIGTGASREIISNPANTWRQAHIGENKQTTKTLNPKNQKKMEIIEIIKFYNLRNWNLHNNPGINEVVKKSWINLLHF